MKPKNEVKAERSHETYCIVLFDGVCRFCNGWVQFIIKHDQRDRFRFSPLQSDYAHSILVSNPLGLESMDTVMLVEGNKVYTHSSAVLQIFKRLGGVWSLLAGFKVIPRPVRDALYRFIARRRYKLFGKYESCMIPTASVREKFIE